MDPQAKSARQEGLDELIAWALPRDGVFATEDAHRFGVSSSALSRAVKSRRLQRVVPRVYVVRGCPATWWARARAASVWAGGALSHDAAAFALDLLDDPPETIDVTRDRWLKAPTALPIKVHYTPLHAGDLVRVRDIPVTSAARTLLDVASTTSDLALEEMLERGLRTGRLSMARLQWLLRNQGRQGRSGTGALRRLLDARGPGLAATASILETKVARWFRGTRLPPPKRQHRVLDDTRFVARIDFAYPEAKVAIEAISYRWHSGRREWVRDEDRERDLKDLGWIIREVIEEDLEGGGRQLEAEIASLLGITLF